MSWFETQQPQCSEKADLVDVLVMPKAKDLGGFSVRRVLPAPLARSVGPFVFFDEMGPARFDPGHGINVRPHPHIGLSTVTYLFEGEILHRDSLGFVQPISPGAVNLMTAGKGIVHSERTRDELIEQGQALHGIQVWMALPEALQEVDPAFVHYPSTCLPRLSQEGCALTVVIGSYADRESPVRVHAETLYMDVQLEQDTVLALEPVVEQRAVYVVNGSLGVGEQTIETGVMATLKTGVTVPLRARSDCHCVVIGGAPIAPRHMWWNFVHTSKAAIEDAKDRWQRGEFAAVPDDPEFIPLPDA